MTSSESAVFCSSFFLSAEGAYKQCSLGVLTCLQLVKQQMSTEWLLVCTTERTNLLATIEKPCPWHAQ